jgi:hypothetical protein
LSHNANGLLSVLWLIGTFAIFAGASCEALAISTEADHQELLE